MSRKGGDETVSVSASFRCSLMGECDTDLEFCLSKDSSGAPKVGIDHRWQVQGEFESRVRAMKSFTRHSRNIHATVARYSRDSSVTLVLQHGDIGACLVNELDMKEIVIISEKMAGPWNPRDQVLVKYEELRETCPALPQNLRPFQVNHHRL